MYRQRREPKVHAIGPVLGSGYHRTLCERLMASGPYKTMSPVTSVPEEVTCAVCLRRIS
jgi:hypothetical protein